MWHEATAARHPAVARSASPPDPRRGRASPWPAECEDRPMRLLTRLHFTGGTSLALDDSLEETAAAIQEARSAGALARLHAHGDADGDGEPVVVYVIPENVLYIE